MFISLAREIAAQGVGRKVAADMFGLALRTYQKKLQRLAESATEHEMTLWEVVLEHVTLDSTSTQLGTTGWATYKTFRSGHAIGTPR